MIAQRLLLSAWLLSGGGVSAQPPLARVASVELPGVAGRIDHFAFDAGSQRVFVAALGNDTVEIVDLHTNAHVRSVAGFHEPQGVAFVQTLKLAAVANGEGEGTDPALARGAGRRSIRVGEDADNVRRDAATTRLCVGYGAGALAAVDPATAAIVGTSAYLVTRSRSSSRPPAHSYS